MRYNSVGIEFLSSWLRPIENCLFPRSSNWKPFRDHLDADDDARNDDREGVAQAQLVSIDKSVDNL